MRRGAWCAFLGAAAVPVVAWTLLRLGFLTPLLNLALSHEFAGRTALQIRVGSLRGDVFHFIDADDVVVLAPVRGAKIPLLTLDHLSVEYGLWPVLRGRLAWRDSLSLVRLHRLNLFVLRGPGGGWNLSPLQGLLKAPASARGGARFTMLPAFRVELDDSEVVLNDEMRGFRSTIDRIQGNLDTRSLPLMAFALAGRTEGHTQRNLALAGAWNQKDASVDGRLNLEGVALARYLNYFLPVRGVRFTAGTASLNVRLRKEAGREMDASGRADLAGGALTLPGIREPLSQVRGEVAFDPLSLRFKEVHAHFLGSEWGASGAILDLRRPRFDLTVTNPAVPMTALSQQVRGLDTLALSGTASVTASLKGPAQAPGVEAVLTVPWLGIAGLELRSVSVSAGLLGSRLTVRRLGGTLWGGQFDGSAGMDLSEGGGLKADMTVTGALLQLARLKGLRPVPFDGLVRAHLVASGLLRSPTMDLGLKVSLLRLGSQDLGDLNAHVAYSPRGLQGRFSSSKGRLEGTVAFSRGVAGGATTFHDTRITLRRMDLGRTAKGLASAGGTLALPEAATGFIARLRGRLGGTLDAVFTVEGPLRSPTVWMRASLPQGKFYPWDGLPALKAPAKALDFQISGFLGFHGNDLILGRGLAPLEASLGPRKQDLRVLALGRYPLKDGGAPGHLSLALALDLRLLNSLESVQKSQGRFGGDLLVTGAGASPLFQGGLSLSGFSCEPTAYLAPITAGSMKLLFTGQALELSGLSFRAPGLVSATGGLDLSGGLGGLRGSVEIRTDAKGLRLQNWDSMGAGNLAFAPLTLRLDGSDQPFDVSGGIRLSEARIVYAGRPASRGAPSAAHRPLALNLHVSLGDNVWYEKLQSKTVDLTDPRKWVSDTLASAEESLLQPDISFRLAPTQHDFVVRGTTPDLELRGELEIDRGRITILENDFNITNDRGPAVIRFQGRRADVSGTAEANLSYTDYDTNYRPKTVEVLAEISPRTQAELDAAGLGGTFLNYQVNFDSDPQIVTDDPQRQQTAVVNLVMLGDPLVGEDVAVGAAGPGGGAPDSGALLASAGLGAVTAGFARKELNQLLRKLRFIGGNGLDVVRLTPRIRYQSFGAYSASGAPAQPQPLAAAAQSQYDIDWIFELGKSFGEKFYTSLQMLSFGENARDSVLVASQSNDVVQNYGMRSGVEYQVSRYRSVDLYGDFGCDDYLNPVAYNATQQFDTPNISYVLQLRNTIPTGNYGTILARRRRWEEDSEGKP